METGKRELRPGAQTRFFQSWFPFQDVRLATCTCVLYCYTVHQQSRVACSHLRTSLVLKAWMSCTEGGGAGKMYTMRDVPWHQLHTYLHTYMHTYVSIYSIALSNAHDGTVGPLSYIRTYIHSLADSTYAYWYYVHTNNPLCTHMHVHRVHATALSVRGIRITQCWYTFMCK